MKFPAGQARAGFFCRRVRAENYQRFRYSAFTENRPQRGCRSREGGRIILKKGDWIILLSVLAAAVVCFGVFRLLHAGSGRTVTVTQDNKTVYTGALTDDHTVTLDGNTVVIRDGRVKMEKADCKNQICVHHAAISRSGESIVCLPNKVLVTIK